MTSQMVDERQRVLVLGASRLQAPALVRSRDLGYRVGTVDQDANAFGVGLADDFFEISTTDVDGIVAAARSYSPAGVLTLGTDMPMRAVAGVSDALGLRGPSFESIIAATDKAAMAATFEREGVAAPRHAVASSYAELQAAVADWDLPFIIKPVDSSGSRGVVLAESFDRLSEASQYSLAHSRSGTVIAQEYLVGREVSVEGFCIGEALHIVTITDKLTTAAPHFVEMGHSQPSMLPEADQQWIRQLTGQAATALRVRDCAVHAEIMLTSAGPRMIEFGARLGGDYITTDLVPLSTGVDMVGALIQLSCGQQPELPHTKHGASAIRYFPERVPAAVAKSVQEMTRDWDGVVAVQFDHFEGGPIRSSVDRTGYVIAHADSPPEAVARCDQVLDLIAELTGRKSDD